MDNFPFPSAALFEGVSLAISASGVSLTDLRGFLNNGQAFDLLLPEDCLSLIRGGELRYISISRDGSRILLWSRERVGMLFNAGVLFGRPLEVMRAKDSHRLFESPPYLGSYLSYQDLVRGEDIYVEDIQFHPYSPEHVAVMVSGEGPQDFSQKLLLIDTCLDADVVGRIDDEYEIVYPNVVSLRFRFGPDVEWLKYCVFVLVELEYHQSEILMLCPVVPKRKRKDEKGVERHEVILQAQDDRVLWFKKLHYYMKISCLPLYFDYANGVDRAGEFDGLCRLSDFHFLMLGDIPVLATVDQRGTVQIAVLDFSRSVSDLDRIGDMERKDEEGEQDADITAVILAEPKSCWQSLSILVVEVNDELSRLSDPALKTFTIQLDPTHKTNFFVFTDDVFNSNFYLFNCERWQTRLAELVSSSDESAPSPSASVCKSLLTTIPVEDGSLVVGRSIVEFCSFLGLVMIVPSSETGAVHEVLDLRSIYSSSERQAVRSTERVKRPTTTKDFNEKIAAIENLLKKEIPSFPNDKSNDPTKIMVNYSKHIWDNYFVDLQDKSRWVLETVMSQEHRRELISKKYKLAETQLRTLEKDIGAKMQWFAHLTTRYHSQHKMINELVKHRWQNGASSEVLNNTIFQLDKCNAELNKLSEKLKYLQDRLNSGQNGNLHSDRMHEGAGGAGGPNKLFFAKPVKGPKSAVSFSVRSAQFTSSS